MCRFITHQGTRSDDREQSKGIRQGCRLHGRGFGRRRAHSGREQAGAERPRDRRERPHQRRRGGNGRPRFLRCRALPPLRGEARELLPVGRRVRRVPETGQRRERAFQGGRHARLPRDSGPQGRGRRDCRHARPLARARRAGGDGPGQGRLLREADVPHHRGGEAAPRGREVEAARHAGGLADDLRRPVVEGAQGPGRRHDRPDDHEPGQLPPQLRGRRMELDRSTRKPGRMARATTTSTGRRGWARRPSAATTPTASSAFASIGITRAASPRTCFST